LPQILRTRTPKRAPLYLVFSIHQIFFNRNDFTAK